MEKLNQTKNSSPDNSFERPPQFVSRSNGFVAEYYLFSPLRVYKSKMFYVRGVGFSMIFKNMMYSYLKKRYRYKPSYSDVEEACFNISLNGKIDFRSREYRQYKLTHNNSAVNKWRAPVFGLGRINAKFPVLSRSLKR